MRLMFTPAVLALAALAALAAGATARPAAAQPLNASERTRLAAGQFMETTASLDRQSGQVSARTRTMNNVMFAGYTGAVGIVLIDANNRIVGAVEKFPFGVDGRLIPGKVANRTDVWTAQVDPAIAQQATRIEIYHTFRALNRFAAILGEAAQRAREANTFKNDICKEFGCAK